MTTLFVKNLAVPGSSLHEENPLPIFRDPEIDVQVPLHETVTPEKRKYFGWRARRRILPYRLQDRYTRSRGMVNFRAIVLENEHLRATFLPEMGGRLISLVSKPTERELLFHNPVFQPANLALRDAWFAGGVEWNIGQTGHWFLTCSPVFAAAIQGAQGEPGLRLYEYERCKNLFWHTDFYLPPDFPFLIAFTRVVNPQDEEVPMYWWTNIAVPEAPDIRVLAPAGQAVYLDRKIRGFGMAPMPQLPSLPGKDASYSTNWPHSNEFFMQCDEADIPWVAALDGNGEGLVEASTQRLKVRKLFCWGMSQGGRHWQDFLAEPGQAYIEIQAGLAPTQLHNLPMAGSSEWFWTEVFGFMQADPALAHSPDWQAAWGSVDRVLKSKITAADLAALEQGCIKRAGLASSIILQEGSGWGALELIRRARQGEAGSVPPAFAFPEAMLGGEQQRWLSLLDGGVFKAAEAGSLPGEWMIQKEWRYLLADSIKDPEKRSWNALVHYGVMQAEAFEEVDAVQTWQESIQIQPNAWAYRNLGALARRRGQLTESITHYQEAWKLALPAGTALEALAHEILSVMAAAGKYGEAWSFCESLPKHVLAYDRIQIFRASAALQLGKLDEVERILHGEFTSVREGEVDLANLWLEMWRRRMSAQTGKSVNEISLDLVEKEHPVPAAIDFRTG